MSSRLTLGFSIFKVYISEKNRFLLLSVQLQGTEEAAVMSWAPTPNATFFCQQILCGWWLKSGCRLKSSRCLHPCRAPGEKFFFSNICVEPVYRRWCYGRVILLQDPYYPNFSALQVLYANSFSPSVTASLPVGKFANSSLNENRPVLTICCLEYTRHLIFQLEKSFTLALLMKINWRHMFTRPRGHVCKHSVRSRLTHTKNPCV